MTYNQKRPIQLLKRSQDLKNQGKNLFIENREEDFELSEYNIAVEEHIFWQDRYQVALSMEDFLNRKIDGKELCGRVYGLRRKLINTCEKFMLELSSGKVKDFQPDPRSKGFGSLISFLRAECDNFQEDYANPEFYDSIKACFLKLQKVLDEEEK